MEVRAPDSPGSTPAISSPASMRQRQQERVSEAKIGPNLPRDPLLDQNWICLDYRRGACCLVHRLRLWGPGRSSVVLVV